MSAYSPRQDNSVFNKFLFILLTIHHLLSTRLSCRCPYGAQERAREVRSDTHQRANQIDRIGASAKIPCPLLSGVGTISRNTPHLREQKSSCVTVDWRSGQPARLPTSFCNFFFLEKKKLTVSPWQRDLALLRRRKIASLLSFQRVFEPFCRKAK